MSLPEPGFSPRQTLMRSAFALAFAVLVTAGLSACGKDDARAPATQVAAQVNDEEISVHQINFALQRSPGITPERAEEAKKAILEQLIEQEVLVQAAEEQKLERNPDVMQRLEAGRREVLARAFLEKVGAEVPKPTEAEVSEFYKGHPELFQNRKLYGFDEIVLRNRPPNWPEIEKALMSVENIAQADKLLREHGVAASVTTNIARATEHLPPGAAAQFDKLKIGDVVIYPAQSALIVAQLRALRPEPVEEEQALLYIEQLLHSRKRGDAVRAEVQRLRESAKVVYTGEFATNPATAESGAAEAVAGQAAEPVPLSTSQSAEALPLARTPSVPSSPGQSTADDTGIDKGLKGLVR
jgi:EpsD family peptidyl-prolyl cis-trans isomerase